MQNSKWTSSLKSLLAIGTMALLISCNDVSSNTNLPESSNAGPGTGNVAVVLGSSFTDPVGTLNTVSLTPPRTATTNLQTTYSDAIVKSFDNILYVVNRLGADNIQVVDPNQNFAVIQQFSVGAGTNPQEIIVTDPLKAYVTLYQPEDNSSSDLSVDDVIIVNPKSGELLGKVDLTTLTADDGDRLARASAMVMVGKKIFVGIQDLPPGFLSPDQLGKIAVIDTGTDNVTASLTLIGRNPVAMNYSPQSKKIYVLDADYTDISSPFGGIEEVDPDQMTSTLLIDDLDLGGAPGTMALSDTKAFVAVGFFDENSNFATKVVSFDLDGTGTPTLTEVYRSKGYIQDIAVDESGDLLIGDRDPAVNGIVFVDPETNQVIDGPINTGAAPSSITFIER